VKGESEMVIHIIKQTIRYFFALICQIWITYARSDKL